MPPEGDGGGEHGCTEQDHPSATGCCDEGAPSHPIPLSHLIVPVGSEMKKKRDLEQEHEHEKDPVGIFTEGPLVEILSRVPYRSLCRFKCVSKPWLALCSNPDIRKRSPQPMAGFFINNDVNGPCFNNLSGEGQPLVDPSLSFLCKSYARRIAKHCCGGLVLCKCWESDYSKEDEYNLVVCNPVTEKWTELPPSPIQYEGEVEQYLGFDPVAPSRFMVFTHTWKFTEVTIYSSDTGRWSMVECGWIDVYDPVGFPVYLNGAMHFMTVDYTIVIVDTEGKVWREIDFPCNLDYDPAIGQSQGRLYAWCIDDDTVVRQLSVWVLEDYGGAKWTLKGTVIVSELFGSRRRSIYVGPIMMFAIHPNCNVIFLTDRKKTISYDMDSRKVQVMGTYRFTAHSVALYLMFQVLWNGHQMVTEGQCRFACLSGTILPS